MTSLHINLSVVPMPDLPEGLFYGPAIKTDQEIVDTIRKAIDYREVKPEKLSIPKTVHWHLLQNFKTRTRITSIYIDDVEIVGI